MPCSILYFFLQRLILCEGEGGREREKGRGRDEKKEGGMKGVKEGGRRERGRDR